MATTINNIKVDFGLGAAPPRVSFLQGANMDITNIRDTIRQLEESDEGRSFPGGLSKNGEGKGWIARAGGNFEFSDVESSALVVEIVDPFDIFFEAGPIPFQSSLGSLLGTFVESPGAIVQINNKVGATNINSADVEYASFNGGVTVDTVNGTAGTVFPIGTERQPVDNFADALTIAVSRGFLKIFVIGDANINSGTDFTNFTFEGQGQNISNFTLDTNANFLNATFTDATITGVLDGDSNIRDCIIAGLTFVSGIIVDCILESGTIVLGGSQEAHFINCSSGVPGQSTPVIDCGGSGQPLAMRNYNGGIELINKTGSESVSLDINSGHIKLANTVTNGDILCRGIAKLTDNSNGATIIDELLDAVALDSMFNMMTDIEGGMNMDDMMRIFMSALAAKMTGPTPGQAGTVEVRNMGDTKTRISTPVDIHGYRGNATYNTTP